MRAYVMSSLRAGSVAFVGFSPPIRVSYDFPDRLVPYFVDRKTGVRCAVAHLLESTGRTDIVDRVRAANNNVLVPQLAGDTALMAWLDASGLTLAEAARIQPTYGARDVDVGVANTYRNTSAVAISASVLSTFWNLSENENGQQPFASSVGVVIGTATVMVGVLRGAFPDPSNKLAVANGVSGAASLFVSARGIMRRNRAAKAQPPATGTGSASARGAIETTVAPAFSLVGQKSAGFAVNVRF